MSKYSNEFKLEVVNYYLKDNGYERTLSGNCFKQQLNTNIEQRI